MKTLKTGMLVLAGLATACAHAPSGLPERAGPPATPSPAPAVAPERVATAVYDYPVPGGFAVVHHTQVEGLWATGGSVISERARVFAGAFLGTIVVTPVPSRQIDPTDAEQCAQVPIQMAAAGEVTNRGAVIVERPWGKTCRFVVSDAKDAYRVGVGTVAYSPTSMWVITCNLDMRDEAGAKACEAVNQGFHFAP